MTDKNPPLTTPNLEGKRQHYLTERARLTNALITRDNLIKAKIQAEKEAEKHKGVWESILLKNNGMESIESEQAIFSATSASNKISRLTGLIDELAITLLNIRATLSPVAFNYREAYLALSKDIADTTLDDFIRGPLDALKPEIGRVIGLYNVAGLSKKEATNKISNAIIAACNQGWGINDIANNLPPALEVDVMTSIKDAPSPAQLSKAKNNKAYRLSLALGQEPFDRSYESRM
ncbi:TPA: hypothetical protein PXN54_002144 [Yersinia enterocolitica]|nr:hypothetical protein [Yersinia enterocolitica]